MSADLGRVELGERLRSARSGANLTQDAAATAVGMSRTTLVAIEKGQRAVRRANSWRSPAFTE
jgi:DNA-binding XRE family transcriptional regulator